MKIGLYITFEPDNGKPVTLARVSNAQLLTAAGRAALHEANDLAEQMSSEDRVLGELQRQEASRLKNALELVIPGFGRVSRVM